MNTAGYLVAVFLLLAFSGCSSERELSESDFRFDGPLGSEGAVIEKIERNLFRVKLGHAPNQPEWNNKLNFEITGNARGNDLVLIVEGPPQYAMNEYFYSWSYDMENWNPVQWNAGYRVSPEIDTLVFPVFQKDRVYVGHQVPISFEQIEAFIAGIEPDENVTVHIPGKSLGGRNLYRITIEDPSGNIPDSEKWVHYYINSHPGEHNAQWRMIGKIEWLLGAEGKEFRQHSINHFVLMMSPDAPRNGWYRVNAQGIDMNRSYRPDGSDSETQAHEAYIFQRDLELLMESGPPITTLWGHHTWGGPVEPLLYLVEEGLPGPWTRWREILQDLAPETLIKPLALRRTTGFGATSWEYGPHVQFGINTILCEGAGSLYTKQENKLSGRLLMESMAEFFKSARPNQTHH
jgi:hypothetical protein